MSSIGRHPPLAHHHSAKKVSLHGWERLLVTLLITQLVFLPWAFGGMRLWSQFIACGLALVTLGVALVPRHYTELNSRTGPHRLSLWPRLLKFPLFWLGLGLMIYVVIQGLNPAWKYVRWDKNWWMEPVPYITWLPHGTKDTPLNMSGPWRSLLVLGTAWLTACSLWVGITRRRSLQILLGALVVSAALLGALAAAQRLTNTNLIYWFVSSPNEFWGTFFYRNHGGAWFNLMVAASGALTFWYYLKALRTFAKSSPAAVYGFVTLALMVAVIASYSRGAVFSLLLFWGLFTVTFAVRQFTLPGYPQKHIITLLLVLLFGGAAIVGLQGLNARQTWGRMGELLKGDTGSVAYRHTARQATVDMWQAAPWLGHGAGSFQLIFPYYQRHYPEIWENRSGRLFWEHAHCDPVETLAEIGVVGSSLLALGFLWGLIRFLRLRAWAHPVAITLMLVLVSALLHSWGELIFQCPAVLVTWLALGMIGLRWAEFEPQSR